MAAHRRLLDVYRRAVAADHAAERPSRYACSAIVEDEDGQPEMWVMGGYDGGNILATVEAYNPRTNTWRSCLPLSQRRDGAVAGVVGGRLVVAGGYADGGVLTSVEAYTPTGWTPLPPLPHAADATACVLNGRLYVMGGRTATSCRCWRCQRKMSSRGPSKPTCLPHAGISSQRTSWMTNCGSWVGLSPKTTTTKKKTKLAHCFGVHL